MEGCDVEGMWCGGGDVMWRVCDVEGCDGMM